MAEVVWTDSAIKDLDDIGEYIAKDSVRYAEVTVAKLFESVYILEQFPRSGTMVVDFGNDLIRELIRGNYRIVYKIMDDERIDILTVHHCARLIDKVSDLESGSK